MTTELGAEDVVVHLSSTPQIISGDSVVAPGAGGGGAGGVELGRRMLLAARAGDTRAVLELMSKGAPFSTDWLGTSPLHLAAANDHADTCSVLLRAGVSRDARTKVERTPLHLAAGAGHARVAALLLAAGAAPDARDMLRMTPLHWAAARGQADAARALLRAGADPRLRCKFRKTPRCLALRAGRPDLAALLEAAERAPHHERMIEDPLKIQQEFKTVQRIETKTQTKMKMQPEKKIIIESKTQPIPQGCAGGAGGAGGAAALLRAHGITLLPADRGSTVLSALRSGRTVVLSDAGKLMLKESVSEPANISDGAAEPGAPAPGAPAAGRGARRPPKCGKAVKLVTLNKNQPVKRIIHPSDLQQMKVVRLGTEAAAAGAGAGVGARLRPALKIVLDKAHLQRLLAARPAQTTTTTYTVSETQQDSVDSSALDVSMEEESVEVQESPGAGEEALRAQLGAARAAIAALEAELKACRERLAHYEGGQM